MIDTAQADPAAGVKDFLARFRENYTACHLERVGGKGDGGYLMPNNLASLKYCFSPGIGRSSRFEEELSKSYGIRSFMADASVDGPVGDNGNFVFTKKFLGNRTFRDYITLSDWIEQSIKQDDAGKILQMDIEGAEYDVLIYESVETLASFSTIIVEFHGLGRLFDAGFLSMFSTIFEKLYKNFSICHAHPNNCCGLVERHGIAIPRILEVTFMRTDLLEQFKTGGEVALPHPLDKNCVPSKDELVLPEIWWRG